MTSSQIRTRLPVTRASVGAAALLAAAYLAAWAMPAPNMRPAVLWLLVLAGGSFAGLGLAQAARWAAGGPDAVRWAWRLWVLGQLLHVVGSLVWLAAPVEAALPLGRNPVLVLASSLQLSHYALGLAALWLMASVQLPLANRLRLLLDVALVLVGAILVAGLIGYGTSTGGSAFSPLGLTLLPAHPAGELALVAALLMAAWHLTYLRRRSALLLAVAVALMGVTGQAFGLVIVLGRAPDRAWMGLGWLASYALVGLAGVAQSTWRRLAPAPVNTPRMPVWARDLVFAAPYLGLAAAFGLLLWGQNRPLALNPHWLAVGVGGIIALIVIRQIVSINETQRLLRHEQRRSEADAVLLELSHTLLAGTDEAGPARAVAGAALSAMRAERCLVSLPRPGEAAARPARLFGRGWPAGEAPTAAEALAAGSPLALAMSTARPVCWGPGCEPPEDLVLPRGLQPPEVGGGVSVPVVVEGGPVGALLVAGPAARAFGAKEVRLLALIANQAAAAYERGRLTDVRRRQLGELTLLHAVATAGAEAGSEDELIERVTRIVADTLEWSNQGVMLLDCESGCLRPHPSYHGPLGAPVAIGVGITGYVAETGRPLRVGEVSQHPRYVPVEPGIHSELCVPLLAGDTVLGVINVESRVPDAFTQADEQLLQTIAQQLATAMQKLRLFGQVFQAEQQRAAELEAVRQASLGLTASLDLQAVLREILSSTLHLLPASQEAYVFLYQAEGEGRLTFGASRAREGQPADDWRPREGGLTMSVARQGEMIVLPDLRQNSLFADLPHDWGGAIVGLPLKVGDRVVGVMHVTYPAPRAFAAAELRVLRLLGDQAAIAIGNARLYAAERAAREQAEALREVAATLNASLDRPQLLRAVLDQLARVVSYDSASIMLFSQGRLVIVAQRGFHHAAQDYFLAAGTELQHLANVLETRCPQIIADTAADPHWLPVPGGEYIRCWLGVPLLVQGRVIGLLNLDKEQPNFYTPAAAELATVFANQAAVAIENVRLFEAERRQLRLAQTLQAVGALLTAEMSLEAVFEQLFDLLAEVVDYDSVSVQLLSPSGKMELAAGRGFPSLDEARANVRAAGEHQAAGDWLAERVRVIPDTANDPRWTSRSGIEHIRSWIGAALVVKDRLLGVITTDSRTPYGYDASLGETVQAFANQAAVAIENARLFEASHRQTQVLTALYNTALDTGSVLETDVLLQRLHEQVQQLLQPDTFVVALYHARTEELEVVLAIEAGEQPAEAVPLGRMPLTQGRLGWVARTRQSLLVADLLAEAWPVPPRAPGTQAPRSWLGVPLIARDRLIGAITVQSFRPGAFTYADQRFLESVARQAAIAIENARLYAEISARADELSRLYSAAQDLGARLDHRVVLQQLAKHLTESVGATSSYVCQVNVADDTLVVLAEYWSAYASAAERRSDLGRVYALADWPATYDVVARQAVVELQSAGRNLSPAEAEELAAYGVRSALILPIVSRGEVLGEAEVWESRRERTFSLAERRLLQTLCQHAAGVIENARLFEATLKHAEEVTTASNILHQLNASADVSESFPAIATSIKAITACERVSLAMLSPQRTKVVMVALDQPRSELPRGQQFPLSATAAANDVLAGHVHLTPDLSAEAHFPAERLLFEAGYRSRLNLPLRVGAQVIGALNLMWREPGGPARANLRLLSQLADAFALALEKGRLFDETRRRDAILEGLADASSRLLLAGNPEDVVPDLLAQLARTAGVSRAYLLQNDDTAPSEAPLGRLRHEWVAPGQQSLTQLPEWAALDYLASGFGRWVQVLSRGRPIDGLVRDFPPGERTRLEALGALSVAVVPIFCGDQWWGCVVFDDCEQERLWSAAEIEALRSTAGALGAFAARQRIEGAEREQRALAEALRDTAAVLNSTLDVDEVLDRILADVGHVVPHESANVMLIEAGVARVVRNRDPRGRFQPGLMLSLEYVVADVPNLRYMLETGQPTIIVDTHQAPGWIDRDETRWIRSNVGAPILIKGKVIGFITLDNTLPGFYTPAHAERLQAFAHQAGLAIENARLYASIRRHAEDMERRVVERTQELAAANERLKEVDRLKDQFISNVSHELRTPLTNIKLYLGLVEKRGAEVLPRHLPTLQRETERLRRLIEDLLDLSRLQTQSEPVHRSPASLDELIDEVMLLHAARAEAKNLTMLHQPFPGGIEVPVDRAQMLQVFTNLLGNAVAYTPVAGHISVSSHVQELGNASGVAVAFCNDGPAIPPEDLPHLFRRFYRGQTGRESGESGTGLGLAICREIAERHGGQIDVASGPAGTTFTIWLPLH